MCTFTLERVNFHRLDVYMRLIDWVFGILRRIGSFWEEHVLKWHKYKMGKWFLLIKSQVMIQCSGSVLQMINLKKCHYLKRWHRRKPTVEKNLRPTVGFRWWTIIDIAYFETEQNGLSLVSELYTYFQIRFVLLKILHKWYISWSVISLRKLKSAVKTGPNLQIVFDLKMWLVLSLPNRILKPPAVHYQNSYFREIEITWLKQRVIGLLVLHSFWLLSKGKFKPIQ